ncbi:MAG: tetratricopeptide repeat protein [Myxococcota bacterium]
MMGESIKYDGRAVSVEESNNEAPTRALSSDTLEGGTAPPIQAGEQIDRYAVLEAVGRGGMGQVVRAYDTRLQREVALKILHRRTDPESRARIVREAQAMARMSHPNVVGVYDVHDSDDGMLFIAMELVVGETLAAWMRRADRAWPEVVAVFAQAARGLAAAHAEGLVHRDFKPSNVLIGEDGRVRVTDFGIARIDGAPVSSSSDEVSVLSGADLTREGTVIGTPAYMAPEQHHGGDIDARSDQYAFCVALFEATVRKRPFAAQDHRELARLKRETSPKWPNTLPAWLGDVVLRGLAVEPDDRWSGMPAILAALKPKPKRWPKVVAGVGATGVLAAALATEAPEEESCGTQEARSVALWDQGRAERVRNGLAESGGAFGESTADRVTVALANWADAWSEEHLAACRGEGGLADAVQVQRTACLERRRERFVALGDQFEDADDEVREAAIRAVASLPDPSACADAKLLAALTPPPSDPEAARVAAALEAELERVRALLSTGRLQRAREALDGLLTRARALQHPPVTGTALWLSGSATAQLGEIEEGVAQMTEAYAVLSGARAHHDAAKVAVSLAGATGNGLRKIDAGRVWATVAAATFDAFGATEYERASVQDTLGVLELLAGHASVAVSHHQRSVQLQGGDADASSPELAESLTGLAASLQGAGRHDEARETFVRALAMAEHELGPMHPGVALLHNNLGVLDANLGHAELALQSYEKSLTIRGEVLGTTHPQYASTLSNSAQALFALGRLDEAKARAATALGTLEAALGPDHADVGTLVNLSAVLHDAAGDEERAEALFVRSTEIIEAQVGPEHPSLVAPLLGLGKYTLRRGDADGALAIGERALAIQRDNEANPVAHSSAQFLVARARWARGEPALARNAARAALAALDGPGPDLAARRESIDRWLAER